MALTPKELLDSQVYLKEANGLEAQIDAHLQQYFSGRFSPIPLLTVDNPREIVKEKIREIYNAAGWKIDFQITDDPSQIAIHISQA